jgi:hypothetical protein
MEKQKKLALIFKHTHRDYKGTGQDKTLMILRDGVTCLVPLEGLRDGEIEKLLPYALKKEQERKPAR